MMSTIRQQLDDVREWIDETTAGPPAPAPDPDEESAESTVALREREDPDWAQFVLSVPMFGRRILTALRERGLTSAESIIDAGERALQMVPRIGAVRAAKLIETAERYVAGGDDLRRGVAPRPVRLRQMRERAGLDQPDVAAALGVTKAAVCHWEMGRARPSPENAEKLVAFLTEKLREREREEAAGDGDSGDRP